MAVCVHASWCAFVVHACVLLYANDTELQMCGCMGIGHVEVNAL